MAKLQKKDIIERFEVLIEEGFMISPESVKILKYAVDNYRKDARNVTSSELSEIIEDLKEETGYSLSELMKQLEEAKEGLDEEALVDDGEVQEQVVIDLNKVKTDKAKLPEKKSAKVENSDKKTLKPKAKEEVVAEEPKAEQPKKETKKLPIGQSDVLESFPEEFYSESLKGTLKLRNDIENIEQFAEAINDKQEDLVIVTFWTKKLLKQYASSYDPYNINPSRVKEFPDNLDVIEVTHASNLVVTGISIYSNVPQVILPGDFELFDNNIRYANGCELQIYEVIEDNSEEATE